MPHRAELLRVQIESWEFDIRVFMTRMLPNLTKDLAKAEDYTRSLLVMFGQRRAAMEDLDRERARATMLALYGEDTL